MERSYGTWQGRLPQELRLPGIRDTEAANTFLCKEYIATFNARFAVPAGAEGFGFRPLAARDLDWIFSVQYE